MRNTRSLLLPASVFLAVLLHPQATFASAAFGRSQAASSGVVAIRVGDCM